LLVTFNNRLKFEIEIVHDLSYHHIHFETLLPPNGILPGAKFTLRPSLALYWKRYCTALQQWASAKLCGVVQGIELRNFHGGLHLYSAGRPSSWASAHIL